MLAHLKIIPYHLSRRFCPTTTKSKYETNTATATNTWKNNPLSSANKQQHQIKIITQTTTNISKNNPLSPAMEILPYVEYFVPLFSPRCSTVVGLYFWGVLIFRKKISYALNSASSLAIPTICK